MQLSLFSRRDVIFIISLLSLVLALLVVYFLFFGRSGCEAKITKDGEILYTVDLNRVETPYEIPIDGEYPLTILVEKGAIEFERATCPDQVCVHTGKLSKEGQNAVCLPAGVSISISGGEHDAVTG